MVGTRERTKYQKGEAEIDNDAKEGGGGLRLAELFI